MTSITSRNDGRTFTVRNWRPCQKNTLLGFCTIELPSGLIVNDVTVHQKNQSRWVSMPAREYTGADGKRQWSPILEFIDAESRGSFNRLALEAIEAAGIL